MSGMMLPMRRQASGSNRFKDHWAADIRELRVHARNQIVGQIDDDLLFGVLIQELLYPLIQRTASVDTFD